MMLQFQRFFLSASALAVFAVPSAFAQEIRGTVIDAVTGAPVPAAEVVLLDPEADRPSVITNAIGQFRMRVPGPGSYALRIRHPSYVPYLADSLVVEDSGPLTIELELTSRVVEVDSLVVEAESGFETRRRSGLGRFMTRDEIESRGATRASELLRTFPGVSIQRVGGRRFDNLITMRGGVGRCNPSIWVDGLRMEQNANATIDQVIQPGMLEGVEVYTSFATAPPQYSTGNCGVILFWTRRGSAEDGEPWQWRRVLIGAGTALLLILLLQ